MSRSNLQSKPQAFQVALRCSCLALAIQFTRGHLFAGWLVECRGLA
jgi:hypothetical protein